MSGGQTRSSSDSRPSLHGSRSFTRMPVSPLATSPRKRASTLQEAGIPAIPEARYSGGSPDMAGKKADVFEFREEEEEDEHEQPDNATRNPELRFPSTFDELPIEIKSLSERFLESLSAKVHPQPLTAEALSEMFQDFYERASSHIATHIATLASRIGRDKLVGSQSKTGGRARAGSGAKRADDSSPASGGEMLTASEVSHRKKARRLLELKRLALEEAVERGVCEKVYDRIFKHRSTDDEARDEKLRSRTAALSVVGIGLKELHMESDPTKAEMRKTAAEKEEDISRSLADAREALRRMDDEHYPAGKLHHLTAAHKSIVETLSEIFPSSSSADEILPTLIYTLITSPPEGISVVSNLNFIQRFRASSKVDGEAAYCLVNLEAAISFLETVDLSSLRADELPQGPPKSNSRPSTPKTETTLVTRPDVARTLTPVVATVTVSQAEISSSPDDPTKPLPSPRTPTSMLSRPQMHQRRLSSLAQAANHIETGRDNFLNAADKIYDSINGTLENSLQFVFGRFTEQASGDSPLPKTLEDARKLVSSPISDEHEEALSTSGRSSPALDDPLNLGHRADKKILEIVGGRNQLRDRSADSARSGGSGRRVTFDQAAAKEKAKEEPSTVAAAGAGFLNSINPLKFATGLPRFGRTVGTPTPASPAVEKPNKIDGAVETASTGTAVEPFPPLEKQRTRDNTVSGAADEDLNAREALAQLRRLKGPKQRFLEVRSAAELRIGEVEELLMEYRRLAKAIGEAVAM